MDYKQTRKPNQKRRDSGGANDDVLTALRSDFKIFLQAIWHQLGLPEPTRAQYAIADYLQYGPKRLMVQAFRGVGKSWITGSFVLWTLFNDSERKVMEIGRAHV